MKYIKMKTYVIIGTALVMLLSAFLSYSALSGNPKEALFYDKLTDKLVQCHICPWNCMIKEGDLGFCRARKNINGTLYALGYAAPCAVHIDPIEKKPFFNYHPGSEVFSLASAGCNLRCKFCQNWEISQSSPLETQNYDLSPRDIVKEALKEHCRFIAYTYSEPTNFYEYMLDICKLAKKRGLKNIYHSNGYINPEPLKALCHYLDAANIDLKGFSEEYYQKICGAHLQPVLDTLVTLHKQGVWLEITNLILPGENDDPEMIKAMCQWIMANLGPDVPLHFSRFYPTYQLKNLPPTQIRTLEQARDIAISAGIHYVYIGNVIGHPGESTYCPNCHKTVVKRVGFSVIETHITAGKCAYCGYPIAGRWGI
jgi:pyruvate formate lyase activating enzyme